MKKFLIIMLSVFMVLTNGVTYAMNRQGYTGYSQMINNYYPERLFMSGPGVDNEIVYCYNKDKEWPESSGTKGYIQTKYNDLNNNNNAIKRIIYLGYPQNGQKYQQKFSLTNDEFSAITQWAVWHYTDKLSRDDVLDLLYGPTQAGIHSKETSSNMLKAFDAMVNSKVKLPEGFALHFYHAPNVKYQNLLGAELIIPEKPVEKEVSFSKVEVNGTKELEGAKIKIVEGEEVDGKVVEEWISKSVQKKITLKEGVYTMVEIEAPEGYEIAEKITFKVTKDGKLQVKQGNKWVEKGNVIIRMEDAKTPIISKVTVQVTKVWKDNNNQDGKRPESITVKLLADGKETGKTIELSSANKWTGNFTDLDEYKLGKKINYSVKEMDVEGYKVSVTGDAVKGYVLTNRYQDKPNKSNKPLKTNIVSNKSNKKLPKTGDGLNPIAWASIMAITGSIFGVFGLKKDDENENNCKK